MRMRYNIFKKSFALCMVLFVVCLSCDLTFASSSVNEESAYIKSILSLVKEFYPDIEPEIESVTPIYFEENICEYAVDISYNNVGYGYVVLESSSMNICRFVINEGAEGFCIQHFNRLPENGEVVLKIDILQYELADKEEISYVGSGNNDNLYDIVLDDFPEPMYQNYSMYFKSTGRVCRFDQKIIDDIGAEYCCGVVAMLNVCGGYKLFDTSNTDQIRNAYKKLWSYSDVQHIKNGYVMDQNKMGRALSRYFKDVKGEKIPYKEQNNPTVDFFVDAVDKKYSSILGVISNSGSGKEGHAVCVDGYYIFKPVNEIVFGKPQIFLSVASGWETFAEYIWYDKIKVDSTYGVLFMRSFK